MTRALYLCYFGLREPLVQAQVLPYLRQLVRGGVEMSLLTFESDPEGAWAAEWGERLRGEGIDWHRLRYHKRPTLPATLFDIVAGAWRARAIVRRRGIGLLHARSHVGAAIGALTKALTGTRLLFDIRGLLPEEYVDSGNWRKRGLLFRLTKMAERWLFRSSDGFVVLTNRAREWLFPDGAGGKPVEVIPCCLSAARTVPRGDRDAVRTELGVAGRVVFVYIGALGGYYLMHEMAELLAVARQKDPRVFALVLTQSPAAPMVDELARAGFGAGDYRVMRADPQDVPRFLEAADVALCILRSSIARVATSPTKFAEYLAAGLPVLSGAGVGDMDAHIAAERVGVVLRSFDRPAYIEALRELETLRRDPELAERCRHTARTHYDLESIAGVRYRRLYDALS